MYHILEEEGKGPNWWPILWTDKTLSPLSFPFRAWALRSTVPTKSKTLQVDDHNYHLQVLIAKPYVRRLQGAYKRNDFGS